jgi:DUF4097 and DUF4098 domain-containing protein YvlB
MMKTIQQWAWIAAVGGVMTMAHGQSLEREGQYWVRTSHTDPARLSPQVKRLELFTRGNVIVKGSEDGSLQVNVKQRVRAGSSEEAARLFGPVGRLGPFVALGNTMRIELNPAIGGRVLIDLEIAVPKQLGLLWVNNLTGSVEVYDIDGNVQADTGGGPVTVDRIRGSVRSHTGLGGIKIGTIGGSLQCSSGGGSITVESAASEVNCATGGGDIGVKYAGGALVISTEGGNIHVEKAGSTVRARSVAGVIEVGQARGAVFADTRGGSIQVGSSNGVRAESGGGTIRVKGGSGPMTVSTMVGNILAELFSGGRLSDSSLQSEAGDITVLIPSGMGLAVRARNESGVSPRIISDFPEIQVRSVGFKAPAAGPGVTGQGSINGGGPVLDLNTSSGTIYLRRAK